jgi:hypothetical protein
MMRFTVSYDDIRKVATIFRKPEATLTSCEAAPSGGIRATVRADLATIADIGKFVKSLVVSIVLDLDVNALGEGRIEFKLLDLNLDKSKAPLLVRPFLRPSTFKNMLFKKIAEKPHVAVNAQAGTVVADLNDVPKLKDLGLKAEIKELAIGPDGIALGLTLAD